MGTSLPGTEPSPGITVDDLLVEEIVVPLLVLSRIDSAYGVNATGVAGVFPLFAPA
jgi:hypothetical protein